uniref:Uncharacterized protein n=1 Tax=Pyricularia oryzae (strain 70-15 / ATCC MYA-4617 / FGSC 8958) TaxID=242507 RepID=Q2KG84_PYRO7|nr:hypothetical protein MGCH7_ch7g451 [Pyricularia oryzae 70-15]
MFELTLAVLKQAPTGTYLSKLWQAFRRLMEVARNPSSLNLILLYIGIKVDSLALKKYPVAHVLPPSPFTPGNCSISKVLMQPADGRSACWYAARLVVQSMKCNMGPTGKDLKRTTSEERLPLAIVGIRGRWAALPGRRSSSLMPLMHQRSRRGSTTLQNHGVLYDTGGI